MIQLTAQVEAFAAIRQEILPLLHRHWQEIALDQNRVKLDPDWQRYERMDDAGQLSIVTMRAAGELVGYCVMMISPELHYRSTLGARMDIFWLAPEMRGRMGGVKLFRAVEAELKRRGVKRAYMGSKLHKDSSRLFEAMGYRPIETWFSKLLEGD